MPRSRAVRAVWGNLAVLALLLSCGVATLSWIANNSRIDDIQSSRVESCERTYEGVREIFRPFFRPPEKRTRKQRRDVAKFNRTVDRLKARCDVQTKED